jgi:large subunit ribosomal protein L22
MKATAKLKHLRIAPRKVRLVVDMVRGKKVVEAQNLLAFSTKRASKPVLKLLNSAVANAKSNLGGDESNLYISKISVDEGPKLKRWRARARGQAYEIQKKTSHINLILEEIKETEKKKKTKKKKEDKPEVQRVKPKDVKVKPKKADKKKVPKQRKEQPKPKQSGAGKQIFRRKAI